MMTNSTANASQITLSLLHRKISISQLGDTAWLCQCQSKANKGSTARAIKIIGPLNAFSRRLCRWRSTRDQPIWGSQIEPPST